LSSRRAIRALAGVLFWLVAASAQASKNGGPEEIARRIVREASMAYEKGHFVDAARLYEKAYRVVDDGQLSAPELLYNAALAYEHAGMCERTVDLLLRFQELAADDANKLDLAPRVKRALECAPELRVLSNPAGAHVFVDGAPLESPTPIGVHLRFGTTHLIELRLDGYETFSTQLSIDRRDPAPFNAALVPVPAGKEASPSPASANVQAPMTRADFPPIEPWIWAAGGVAVAGLATGGVLYGLALDEANKQRADIRDPNKIAQAGSEMRKAISLAHASWVPFTIAAVAGATGLVLFGVEFFSIDVSTPVISAGQSGVSISGRW
jgi:PEGA domain-containing protein